MSLRAIVQQEVADCGAACLAMVLGYHGRPVSLAECRAAIGSGRGTDALTILRGAEDLGLTGHGESIQLDDLASLPRATILHWEFNHFVVLDRVRRRGLAVLDPARGRRFVPWDEVDRCFTGVALVFDGVTATTAPPPRARRAPHYVAHVRQHRSRVFRVVALSIVLRVLALAVPIFTGLAIERASRSNVGTLTIAGLAACVAALTYGVTTLVRALTLVDLRVRLEQAMTRQVFGHMLTLPLAFFMRRSAADLMARVQANSYVRELLMNGVLAVALDAPLAVMYLLLLANLNLTMAITAAAFAAAQFGVARATRWAQREGAAAERSCQARTNAHLSQVLAGIETVRAVGAEAAVYATWSRLYVDELNASGRRARLTAVIESVAATLSVGAPVVLLWTGTEAVTAGRLSLSAMLAGTALSAAFLAPVSSVAAAYLRLQDARSQLDRIDDVLDGAAERSRVGDEPAVPLTGRIACREVSFTYAASEQFALDRVSLEVTPGQLVAIVGASGSGKSTLASLIAGLYQPTSGTIEYDGVAIVGAGGHGARSGLGFVPQRPFLFAGSIRDNIALATPDASLDDVMFAARQAHVHDEIMAMPMGYDTNTSDGGGNVSGGQRQRIALARALLARPAVILLDEGTSSLDANTERAVMATLGQMRCTRIVIAHRLSTVRDADRILVMADGRIVEQGDHDALVAQDGVYRSLIKDQSP